MADIKSYLKEKEKREQNQDSFKDKIRKHRLSYLYRILLVLLAVGALITLVLVQYKNHIYTDYEVVSTVAREAASGTKDIRLGDCVLTYSRDGAHCTDLKGNVLWNQTYGMQDILLSVCEDVVALADYNGRNVYVVSSDKVLGSFTTTMPIRSITVAANGNVVVVMADTEVTYFNIYAADGRELWTGEATMSGSGYPAAISMSPSGELVQVAFFYLDAGVQKTNIAFYNLGEVGNNYTDNIVNVYIYNDQLLPYVQFMNNESAFAVGDREIVFYKGNQIPLLQCSVQFTKEVRSVFYNDKYVGLVFYSDNTAERYCMEVYNNNGEPVGTYYFDMEYTDIIFEQENFIVYSDTECMVTTMDGTEKFRGSFDKTVKRMIPTGSAYKYVLLTNESIDTIQLK